MHARTHELCHRECLQNRTIHNQSTHDTLLWQSQHNGYNHWKPTHNHTNHAKLVLQLQHHQVIMLFLNWMSHACCCREIARLWRLRASMPESAPCDFYSGMVASPFAAATVIAILRCKLWVTAKYIKCSQCTPQTQCILHILSHIAQQPFSHRTTVKHNSWPWCNPKLAPVISLKLPNHTSITESLVSADHRCYYAFTTTTR